MTTPIADFSATKRRPRMKATKLTDGLEVTGLIDGRHLHQAFGADNYANINVGYAQIFAATDRYHGKPVVGMTEAKAKVKKIPSHGFRWELSGGAAQKARITKVVNTDARPGINLTTIDIVVDKPWFNISDIVIPNDQNYRLKVISKDGSRSGRKLSNNQYQYTLAFTTMDRNKSLPRKFLQENAEWRKVSSAVANESNQDYGGFQFYSIFQSEGVVQQHAVKVELTDKAARKAKAFADGGFKSEQNDFGRYANATRQMWTSLNKEKATGKPIMRFMSVLEAEMFNELYRNVENTLVFGQESSRLYSSEDFQIYTASGLREQLMTGWTLPHNGNLTLGQLESWFDGIIKDRIAEGKQQIVLSAGREFRKMFDRMIKSDLSSFMTLDTHFIRKGDGYRHMDYGSYFASYRGFTVDIMVMENPAYDNEFFSPKMHPIHTNIPVESWSADILDFGYTKAQGTQGSTDNICMVCEDFCDYYIKYSGKYYAHDGKSGMPITDGGYGMAGNISGYSINSEKSAGLMIADVTRCGRTYLETEETESTVNTPTPQLWWTW